VQLSEEPKVSPPPRKKRSGSEQRERGVVNTFRSTRDERATAEMDAAALGLTFGSYIRWLLFEHPQTRPTRRPLPNEILLAQLRAEAGHADGNLAQFLRKANRGKVVPSHELDDAFQAVRDFWSKATALLFEEI
jgi:hypothetical protein